MKQSVSEELWYKNAIFYAVIVEVFKDGNNDGIGDFIGLTQSLEYLSSLGISCIWLLPFYPTSGRDNGYDITDYYSVDPRLGTMQEFETFVHEANKCGIKVIIDLVVHHTSDKHDWFDKSKQGKDRYKDYYVWTKKIPKGKQTPSAFPGIEAGVWEFDPIRKAFYYHSFYHFEPDLNVGNPEVQKEIEKIMRFWMEKGIDGFRMDAATLMFSKKGLERTEVKDAAQLMSSWHTLIKSYKKDAIILAEADVTIGEIPLYFGDGGRMDLLYNFLLNRYIFLSLAKKDASDMKEFMDKLPVPPFTAQWVNFLRNHDELNIQQLQPKDKELVFKTFAPDPGMIVYDRGIRRRLAPMLNGDIRWLRMSYSLLFALPGAVMILYGDEIGMGDDLRLPERVSVRIPMQWGNSDNGGFSRVDSSGLVRTPVKEGQYGYKTVNVKAQQKDSLSLLTHIKSLIKLQKEHLDIGHGKYSLLDVHPASVLAMTFEFEGKVLLTLHNLSEEPCTAVLEQYKHTLLEEFYSDNNYEKKTEHAHAVAMHGFGFRWFFVSSRKNAKGDGHQIY